MFRRAVPSLLLLVAWFTLGTGLMAHLHYLQHAEHDHAATPFQQNDTNCPVHAQIHTPALTEVPHALPVVAEVTRHVTPLLSQKTHFTLLPVSLNPRAPPCA